MKIDNLKILELLKLHSEITDKLENSKIIRSANNPVADYAEYIVSKGLNLKLENLSQAGYDAKDKNNGKKYEIKGRKRTNKNLGQFSVFRGLNEKKFDYFVGVLFKKNYEVEKVWKVSYEIVMQISNYNEHVNGWRITVKQLIKGVSGVEDITDLMVRTQINSGV